MSQAANSKTMTIGESGLTVVFAATAFLCTIGAASSMRHSHFMLLSAPPPVSRRFS